jgi:hypothetical protein
MVYVEGKEKHDSRAMIGDNSSRPKAATKPPPGLSPYAPSGVTGRACKRSVCAGRNTIALSHVIASTETGHGFRRFHTLCMRDHVEFSNFFLIIIIQL